MIKYDAKRTHVWTIGEFSKKIEMENGRVLESDKFSIKVGDKLINWYVEIYPNGKTESSIGYITAFLIKASKTEHPVDVQLTFSIVDSEGFKSNSRTSQTTFIQSKGHGYGPNKYFSHSKLKKVISDDTITIMCEMTIKGGGGVRLVGSGDSSILSLGGNVEAFTKKYMEDMGNVFHAGKYTDVTIVCQDREILTGRSSVFEAMFSHNFKEAEENKVEVVDIDADTFAEMLIFMYNLKKI